MQQYCMSQSPQTSLIRTSMNNGLPPPNLSARHSAIRPSSFSVPRPFAKRRTQSDFIGYQHPGDGSWRASTSIPSSPATQYDRPSTASGSAPRTASLSSTTRACYITDNWQPSSRLSVAVPLTLQHARETCLLRDVVSLQIGHERPPGLLDGAPALRSDYLTRGTKRTGRRSSLSSQSRKLLTLMHDGRILQFGMDATLKSSPEQIFQLDLQSRVVATAASEECPVLRLSARRIYRTAHKKRGCKALRTNFLFKNQGTKVEDLSIQMTFDAYGTMTIWLMAIEEAIASCDALAPSPAFYGGLLDHTVVTPRYQTAQSLQRTQPTSSRSSYVSYSRPDHCSSVTSFTDWNGLKGSLTSGKTSCRSSINSSLVGPAADAAPTSDLPKTKASLSRLLKSGRCTEANLTARTQPHRRKSIPEAIVIDETFLRLSTSSLAALPSPGIPRTPTLVPEIVDQDNYQIGGEEDASEYTSQAVKMAQWLENTPTSKAASSHENTDGSMVACADDYCHNASPKATSLQDSKTMRFEGPNFSLESANDTTSRNHTVRDVLPRTASSSIPQEQPTQGHAGEVEPRARRQGLRQTASNPASLSSYVTLMARDGSNLMTEKDTFPSNPPQASRQQHKSRPSRSQNLSISVHQDFLAGDRQYQPQRSPAVAGTHLTTCVGIRETFSKQFVQRADENLGSPLSAKALTPMAFAPSNGIPPGLDASSRRRHVRRQQSLPAIICRVSSPLSPPPTAPLPDIPRSASSGLLLSATVQTLSADSIKFRKERLVLRHTRSATLVCLTEDKAPPPSPLASNPPSIADIKHARDLPRTPASAIRSALAAREKEPSFRNSGIAALAAQLQILAMLPSTATSQPETPTLKTTTAARPPLHVRSIDAVISVSS